MSSATETVTRWRAPGRVNLIGEHTDYNGGFALPFALEMGVTATATARSDGLIEVRSAQAQHPVVVPVADLRPGTETDWFVYPLGVVWALAELVKTGQVQQPGSSPSLSGGVSISVDGDVPSGSGLSSSAALICATAAAVNQLWELGLDRRELIRVARRAENEYLGLPNGGMDQAASLLCERGHALFIDNRDMSTDQVPLDLISTGLSLLVIDSRSEHRHAEGGYRRVVAACNRAAAALNVDLLREVSVDDLTAALPHLQDDADAAGALRHIVTEDARVLETVRLLKQGDVAGIGPLLNASGDSLRDDLRITTPEIDLAVETARQAGAIGSRITGGGFGGCTINLVPAERVDGVMSAVQGAYAKAGFAAPRHWLVEPAQGAHSVA